MHIAVFEAEAKLFKLPLNILSEGTHHGFIKKKSLTPSGLEEILDRIYAMHTTSAGATSRIPV